MARSGDFFVGRVGVGSDLPCRESPAKRVGNYAVLCASL